MSLTTYTNVYILGRSHRLPTKPERENYICANCNLRVPEKNLARNKDGTRNVELWGGGVNGQYARHLWPEGCDAARKRIKNAEEPNLVY